jgi:transposase
MQPTYRALAPFKSPSPRRGSKNSLDGNERLVGRKYLWLYGTENVPQDRFQDFYALRSANLKTSRAWASKETLRALWDMPTLAAGSETPAANVKPNMRAPQTL